MKKVLTLFFGLIFLLIPIYDWITNASGLNIGASAMSFLMGSLTWFIILIGAVMVILGINSITYD